MKKKVFTWLVVVFLLFWLITDPRSMATSASSLADGIGQLFRSFIQFLGELG